MGIATKGNISKGLAINGNSNVGLAKSGQKIFNPQIGVELEYIQGDGNQYIKTNFVVPETNNFQIEIEYCPLKASDAKMIYGSDNYDYSNNNFGLLREYEKLIILNRESGYTPPLNSVEFSPISINNWYTIIQRRDYLLVNETRYDYPKPEQQAKPTNPLYLFGTNRNGNPTLFEACRIKRFSVRMDEGGLILNLIPFLTQDNVVCMKDTVSGNLFLNSGTGEFKGPNNIVSTTSSIINLSPNIGDTITTKGFYIENDGGAAVYDIIASTNNDGITTFETANGRTAKLRAYSSMNILQFGAKPGVESSSFENIKAAFNSLASTINFPNNKEFLIDRQLWFMGDKNYNGNQSTIVTNDTMVLEHYISEGRIAYVMNANNIIIDGLNIKSIHTTYNPDTSAKIQLAIHRANNITIKNCRFEGPPPQYNSDGSAIIDFFSNVDIYSGIDNCIVENNKMYLSHDGFEGTCVMIRDLWEEGTSNVHVRNNYMEKVCHDEILSVGMPRAVLSNIHIYNNIMIMRDGQDSSSVYAVTLMDNASVSVENLTFTYNTMDVQTTYSAIKANTFNANKFVVENNTITHRRGKGYAADGSDIDENGYMILRTGDSSKLFSINNNILNVHNEGVKKVKNIFFGENTKAFRNTINIFGDVPEAIFYLNYADNNIVNSNGSILNVFRNTLESKNNIINAATVQVLYGYFNNIFNNQITINNNLVNAGKMEGLVLSISGSATEGNKISIQDDIYLVLNPEEAYLYGFYTELNVYIDFIRNKVNNQNITTVFSKRLGLPESNVVVIN